MQNSENYPCNRKRLVRVGRFVVAVVTYVRGNVFQLDHVILVHKPDVVGLVRALRLLFFRLATRGSRGRLERFQRGAIVAGQRRLAVGGQPVSAAAPVADLAIFPILVVLHVQNGHLHALGQLIPGTQVALRQRRYPQAVSRVHADVRPGHAVRVVDVIVVVVHLQIRRVVPAVNARVRAARQRILQPEALRPVVQSGRRLGNLYKLRDQDDIIIAVTRTWKRPCIVQSAFKCHQSKVAYFQEFSVGGV